MAAVAKRSKTAIAVYFPSDTWEKAIQDACKQATNEWLPAYPCQLLARSIASLKIGTDWLEKEELMPVRASYLFNQHLCDNDKRVQVFTTHFLFLRDILENNEINIKLHNPIVFMTPHLANFIFRNNPVHIYLNADFLHSFNKGAKFVDVGGLSICEENLMVNRGMITDVLYYGKQDRKNVDKLTGVLSDGLGVQLKVAASEIHKEIFKIDEHFKDVRPGMRILDKLKSSEADVLEVEPGETGIVRFKYLNGNEGSIAKEDFDQQCVIL